MKKIIVAFLLCSLMLVGCGKNNGNLVNKDYTIDMKETDEAPTETHTKGETEDETKAPAISESDDEFAYKISDGVIMDFDSVKGPYYIFSIADNKVELLDCTSKSGKVVDYSFDGNILTLVLYSNEHPINEKYVIDTSVKSVGTLPMS